ncbi:hypothetical protein GH714_009410 [Hevea brasiliensis]|uniref:non-specific serine/threonine protein kinase n=1 Tax=Hevea brasiliensis TaxID=3981 RepID=A0A6A6L228_HEVBR|nr:hypothetical protein GH714_009410 [Hevea brasiliensis]
MGSFDGSPLWLLCKFGLYVGFLGFNVLRGLYLGDISVADVMVFALLKGYKRLKEPRAMPRIPCLLQPSMVLAYSCSVFILFVYARQIALLSISGALHGLSVLRWLWLLMLLAVAQLERMAAQSSPAPKSSVLNNPTPNVSHRVEPNGSDNEPYRSQKQKSFGRTNFQEDYQLRRFTYQELTTATGGFSEDNRLDEGPLGQVFKGDLNGKMVTVKKFNNSRKQEEEYTKMKAINLIGYCEEGVNRLLVYEFVPQDKSLRYYLFGHGYMAGVERSLSDWTTGVRISQAAATLIYIWIFQVAEDGREMLYSDFATRNSTR